MHRSTELNRVVERDWAPPSRWRGRAGVFMTRVLELDSSGCGPKGLGLSSIITSPIPGGRHSMHSGDLTFYCATFFVLRLVLVHRAARRSLRHVNSAPHQACSSPARSTLCSAVEDRYDRRGCSPPAGEGICCCSSFLEIVVAWWRQCVVELRVTRCVSIRSRGSDASMRLMILDSLSLCARWFVARLGRDITVA